MRFNFRFYCFIFVLAMLFSVHKTLLAAITPKIATGKGYTIALKPDGTVWSWGSNENGALGRATERICGIPSWKDERLSKILISKVDDINDVIDIAAGAYFALALKRDGTVWAWGDNENGQLGNDDCDESEVPLQVPGLDNMIAVAAGYYHTVTLKSDGTVWAWGNNIDGQLGNGKYGDSKNYTPRQVKGLDKIIAITAAKTYTLALRSDGTVWGWGDNSDGQLGNDLYSEKSVPVRVGTLDGVVAISAGTSHAMALKSDGTVWMWGESDCDQLRKDDKKNSAIPSQVIGVDHGVAIAVGNSHSIVLRSDGTVWAWGENRSFQLGNGTRDKSCIPGEVYGLNDIIAIATKYSHNAVIKSDGTVWSWGHNTQGSLGNDIEDDSAIPVQAMGFNVNAPTVLPVAITALAENITTSSATLCGTVHTDELPAFAIFVYGDEELEVQTLTGTGTTNVHFELRELSPNTTYYYRVVAKNGTGIVYGTETSFITQSTEKISSRESVDVAESAPKPIVTPDQGTKRKGKSKKADKKPKKQSVPEKIDNLLRKMQNSNR